ncbi:MAG: hypothetical protein LH628_00165 [Microcoleus sp. CAN_BIN18]|nr:hypothetical protein [Microcoleus sp. CAN_BIN18]
MCGRFWQRCDESSSIARFSAIQFLWNCREAALHIISPLAIDRQLNFLRFRPLCVVDHNLRSEIFRGEDGAVGCLTVCTSTNAIAASSISCYGHHQHGEDALNSVFRLPSSFFLLSAIFVIF